MRLNYRCLNLPFTSFASLQGFCLKSGAIRISTARDADAARYQHSSSSDMLWRLVRCCSYECVSPLPLFKVTSAASCQAPVCKKARMQHEMGFIGEQLHLLAYLKTRSMLSDCVKRLAMCAESILISSRLPSLQQALSKWQSNFASIRKWMTSSPNWKAEDGTADGSLPPS